MISVVPPLSLYIHLPWCESKCPYCDFNSYALKQAIPEQVYLDVLLDDLDCDIPLIAGREVQSIFIGGGTPSLFSGAGINRLIDTIAARLAVANHVEITLESNPGSAEREKFMAFKVAGVNRLSLGVQSFNDASLQHLGRVHSGADAISAVELAREIDFDHINIDLMFGLPKQTLVLALADLECAIAFSPNHISYYQLTLEPNTLFHLQPPQLPHEERIEQIESRAIAMLAANDYCRYEISAYAKPGCRSQHNLNYWNYGDYLGIGAGAHAKLTLEDGSVSRFVKHRQPAAYMKAAKTKNFCSNKHVVSKRELQFEFMLNTTRLTEGFRPTLFAERTGLTRDSIDQALMELEARGLLVRTDERICVTAMGRRFLNEVQMAFLPA